MILNVHVIQYTDTTVRQFTTILTYFPISQSQHYLWKQLRYPLLPDPWFSALRGAAADPTGQFAALPGFPNYWGTTLFCNVGRKGGVKEMKWKGWEFCHHFQSILWPSIQMRVYLTSNDSRTPVQLRLCRYKHVLRLSTVPCEHPAALDGTV